MNVEIEKKFLVKGDFPRTDSVETVRIVQGYLCSEPQRTVRVRTWNDRAFLCIKGKTENLTRTEFEYEIPADDARALLLLCPLPPIAKTRHKIPFAGHVWEVDVFDGQNAGLTLAEVELRSEDERVELPCWVGEDVSRDKRFYNSQLAQHPFSEWEK